MIKLKRYTRVLQVHFALGIMLVMSACAVKPSSDMDSPAYHHKAGMRHLDMGEYQSAVNSFSRATCRWTSRVDRMARMAAPMMLRVADGARVAVATARLPRS